MTEALAAHPRWSRPKAQVLAGLFLACLFISAPPSAAEEKDAADALDESTLFAAIPSVYSASKYEQKVTQAPSTVSIVTGDEIQEFGYRTLGDILAGQQGIFTTDDRNYQYLAVRGFGIAGDYNTRILLLIDGHRLNDPVYDSAPTGTDFPVDVDLIERESVASVGGGSATVR